MESLFGPILMDAANAGHKTKDKLAKAAIVGIYLADGVMAGCKATTQSLIKLYNEVNTRAATADTDDDKASTTTTTTTTTTTSTSPPLPRLEIVYVSQDASASAAEEVMQGMPWLALPFGSKQERNIRQRLGLVAAVLPSLVFIDCSTNQAVVTDGRAALARGSLSPARFPNWRTNCFVAQPEMSAAGSPLEATIGMRLHADSLLACGLYPGDVATVKSRQSTGSSKRLVTYINPPMHEMDIPDYDSDDELGRLPDVPHDALMMSAFDMAQLGVTAGDVVEVVPEPSTAEATSVQLAVTSGESLPAATLADVVDEFFGMERSGSGSNKQTDQLAQLLLKAGSSGGEEDVAHLKAAIATLAGSQSMANYMQARTCRHRALARGQLLAVPKPAATATTTAPTAKSDDTSTAAPTGAGGGAGAGAATTSTTASAEVAVVATVLQVKVVATQPLGPVLVGPHTKISILTTA